MSSLADAMKTLTAQYYNALTGGLGLNPQQFQITQGQIALGATSQSLWGYLDTIPPVSIANTWTPGGQNTFSSQYGALISRLKDSASSDWRTAMGDWSSAWVAYLKANKPAKDQSLADFFRSWALTSGMPPAQAQQVASLYAAALNGPIFQANEAYTAAGGQTGVKAYTETIESATHAILSNAGKTVSLDSASESSDVSHTWAKAAAEGLIEEFFIGGEGSYDHTATTLITAGVDIKITFDHIATIPARQLSQGSITAGPDTFPAWYVPAALSDGYNSNNNEVWQDGSPNWTSFFGPSGAFQRTTQAVVVVDGISITMTSSASFEHDEQTKVEAAFSAGFFPFFGVEGEGGWTKATTNFDQGQVSVSQSSPVGNPQIIGILQIPIENFVAAQTLSEAILGDRRKLAAVQPETTVKIIDPENPRALLGVSVNWLPAAFAALQLAHPNPGVQQVVFTNTNSWACNNAPGWAIGALHQYLGATAQRVVGPGGGTAVNIIAYH